MNGWVLKKPFTSVCMYFLTLCICFISVVCGFFNNSHVYQLLVMNVLICWDLFFLWDFFYYYNIQCLCNWNNDLTRKEITPNLKDSHIRLRNDDNLLRMHNDIPP